MRGQAGKWKIGLRNKLYVTILDEERYGMDEWNGSNR